MLLAIGLVIVAAAVAGAAIGTARVARHEARAAADLGALAGAMRAREGGPTACAEASRLVRANGATVTSCVVQGWEIVVYAQVPTSPLPGMTRRATAGARAGPIYPMGEWTD
jgi:secretion/DNA translocation related TadE-like protein